MHQVFGLVTKLTIEDELAAPLQQQKLIESLKDVDAGLMYCTHNGPACVDYVAHCAHDNSSSTSVQTCKYPSGLDAWLVNDAAALPPVKYI